MNQPCQQQQGGGGIIQQRAKAALTAVTDPSFYASLTASTKTKVDAIDAKDPMSRTNADVLTVAHAILEAAKT
jgi:hypothetical protein